MFGLKDLEGREGKGKEREDKRELQKVMEGRVIGDVEW